MNRPFPAKPRLALRLLALALGVGLLAACDQVELGRLYFANSGSEVRLRQSLPVTLPFREENGWIIVAAKVNDAPPVDFVLDTGASLLAILASERTAALSLDMSRLKRYGRADNLAAPTGAVQEHLDIDFGPLVFLDQTALAIPAETLKCSPEIPDPPFQGVIGHELFHRYVVEIDYDRGVVVLHDPQGYRYAGTGQVVPADISGRQPYVQALVIAPDGSRYDARLHVDSGAGIDLSLFPKTHAAIKVPGGGKTTNGCFVGGLASYHSGSSVLLSLGEGAALETPASYALGEEVIDRGQHGRLGSRFLRRHKVIFDYSRGQMILEPRAPSAAGAEAVATHSAPASNPPPKKQRGPKAALIESLRAR